MVEPGRPGTQSGRRSPWRLLRHPCFRLYFIGSLTSNFGTWLQTTAQLVIAYQITHSVVAIGLITSAQFAGMLLVSPWAAVVVSRRSAKAVLVGTQSVSAVIATGMAWCDFNGRLGFHTLLIGGLALGFAYALALPVQAALVTALVDAGDATDAAKMNSVSYNIGRALAPALGVLLVVAFSPDLIFALNALSFVVFAAILWHLMRTERIPVLTHFPALRRFRRFACVLRLVLIPINRGRRRHPVAGPRVTADAARGGSRTNRTRWTPAEALRVTRRVNVTDGLKIALLHRRILLLLAIVAAVTFADDPILVLSPALAHSSLHVSSYWSSYFIAALGWGAVLGSLPATSTGHDSARRASRHAALWLLVLAISVIVFAMGISPQISLVAAIVAGVAGLLTGSAAQATLLRQQGSTKASVSSMASLAALWAIAWAGTKPLASLIDAELAARVGIMRACLALTLPAIAIGLCEITLASNSKRAIAVSAERVTSHILLRSSGSVT